MYSPESSRSIDFSRASGRTLAPVQGDRLTLLSHPLLHFLSNAEKHARRARELLKTKLRNITLTELASIATPSQGALTPLPEGPLLPSRCDVVPFEIHGHRGVAPRLVARVVVRVVVVVVVVDQIDVVVVALLDVTVSGWATV